MDPPGQYGAGMEMQQMNQQQFQPQQQSASPVFVESYVVTNMPVAQPQYVGAEPEPSKPHHSSSSGCSKGTVWGVGIFVFIVVAVSLGVGLGVGLGNVIVVTVQSANTKQLWMEAMATEFNNSNIRLGSRRIVIRLLHTGSNISSTIQPDLWSPATDDWITQINSDYQVQLGRPIISNISCPSSASIPLGIAMWKSMAELLGWPNRVSWNTIASLAQNPAGWGAYGRAGLGAFKFGHGHPVYSNSGRLSVISMIHAFQNISSRQLNSIDIGQQSVFDSLLNIQRRVFHYGKIDTDLLDRMVTRGKGYLHAVTNYESNVIRYNRDFANQLEEPLVLLYATEGTFWNNHPLCIVDRATWSDPDRVSAAKIFQAFLLAREQQAKAPTYGVRPTDSSVNINVEPFTQANGVVPGINVETVATLPLPQSTVIDSIISLWASVKTPAYIVLVLDTSGSMSTDNRIVFARRGAITFIQQMYPQDWLRIIQFNSGSTEVQNGAWGSNRTISNIRRDAIDLISGLTPGGSTALYDTVYTSWQLAQNELTADIQNNRPRRNYGVIVMTDGQDTNSQRTLSTLLSQLPNGEDSNQVHIWTIGYGDDIGESELKSIATQTNGKYFKAGTTNIEQIYFDISSEL